MYTFILQLNQKMAKEEIPAEVQGATNNMLVPHKQMSHFDTSLRGELYLFPAAGGKTGQDWN